MKAQGSWNTSVPSSDPEVDLVLLLLFQVLQQAVYLTTLNIEYTCIFWPGTEYLNISNISHIWFLLFVRPTIVLNWIFIIEI